MHSSTKATAFELILERTQLTLGKDRRPELEDGKPRSASPTTKWLEGLESMVSSTSENMREAQNSFKASLAHCFGRGKEVLRQAHYFFIRKESFQELMEPYCQRST